MCRIARLVLVLVFGAIAGCGNKPDNTAIPATNVPPPPGGPPTAIGVPGVEGPQQASEVDRSGKVGKNGRHGNPTADP